MNTIATAFRRATETYEEIVPEERVEEMAVRRASAGASGSPTAVARGNTFAAHPPHSPGGLQTHAIEISTEDPARWPRSLGGDPASPPACEPSLDIDIDATFRHMEYRKLRRQCRGKYTKTRQMRKLWLLVFLLLLTGMGALSVQAGGVQVAWDSKILAPNIGSLILLIGTVLVLYAMYKVIVVVKWCLYWLIAAVMLLIIVSRQPLTAISLRTDVCPPGSTRSAAPSGIKSLGGIGGLGAGQCPEDRPCLEKATGECVGPEVDPARVAILVLLIVLEVVTLLVWLFYHLVLPRLVKRQSWSPSGWFRRLQPAFPPPAGTPYALPTPPAAGAPSPGAVLATSPPAADGLGRRQPSFRPGDVANTSGGGWWLSGGWSYLTYRNGVLRFKGRHRCRYEGQGEVFEAQDPATGAVLRRCRPHGRGEWIDDSYHGECLSGLWEHGCPQGPFRSRESGSGYSFMCVRIGAALCRLEPPSASRFVPRADALRVGVAAVECCTSGKFFRSMPFVDWVVPPPDLPPGGGPSPPPPTGWCRRLLASMHHISQDAPVSSLVVSLDHGGISVTGHPARFPDTIRIVANDNSLAVLADDGSVPETKEFREALVFVPGFNTSAEVSLQRFGQLLCLGEFPPYIKPFLFSYPAGQIFSYTQARREATTPTVGQAFAAFVQGLLDGGCRTVHVMAHSMGALVFLRCFREAHTCFTPLTAWQSPHSAAAPPPRLGCVVLLNPDCPLDEFLPDRAPPSGGSGGGSASRSGTSGSASRGAAIPGWTGEPGDPPPADHYSLLRAYTANITMYGDSEDGALFWSEQLNRSHEGLAGARKWLGRPRLSLGKHIDAARYPRNLAESVLSQSVTPLSGGAPSSVFEGQPLDMDVVDTTWMESNVHAIRHSYFNINREFVEDLRELIVTQHRARLRPRLMLRQGNVYSFLGAPSCVVNP